MPRLELKCQPRWLELGRSVRSHVRPCTTALVITARAAVSFASVHALLLPRCFHGDTDVRGALADASQLFDLLR